MSKWVLIHGWGMSASIFDSIRASLGGDVQVWELPGHGQQAWLKADEAGLDAWVTRLLEDLPDEPVSLMGWSLGGTIALAALARAPERIDQVFMCAATPRFTATSEWPGTPAQDLALFQEGLKKAPMKTMLRFMALQARGLANSRETLGYLKHLILEPQLNWTALATGLSILATADLRDTAKANAQRVHVLLGEKDFLIPVSVQHTLKAYGLGVRVICGCAHTPFLSHPKEFIEWIQQKHHTSI